MFEKKRKILVLTANPSGTNPLWLEEEVREIQAEIERSRNRDNFSIVHRGAVRVEDMQRLLQENRPQVVHFAVHGAGEGGLVFIDSQGQAQSVDTEALANQFKLFKDTIECVVLNGCFSANQAKAISQVIPVVIGTSDAIEDKTAIRFAKGFYCALAAGDDFVSSHKQACASLKLEGKNDHSHIIFESEDFNPQPNPIYPKEVSQSKWIIFGAGRIGRGLINVIASELNYETTLIVGGNATTTNTIRQFQNSSEYNVRIFDDINFAACFDKIAKFSQFLTKDECSNLIHDIASTDVEIVSTSVGFNNLNAVSGVLAQGIKNRIRKGIQKKIHILVFENGQTNDKNRRLLPGKYFQELIITNLLNLGFTRIQIQKHIHIPDIVLDCYIPNIPQRPGENIVRERGRIWIEDTEDARSLFSDATDLHELVNLNFKNSDEMQSVHCLKNFGFNSLNVFYALITLIINKSYIHEAIKLTPKDILEEVKESIILAICLESIQQNNDIDPIEYCNYCHDRMNDISDSEWHRNTQDHIERIYPKLLRNDYSKDDRIYGPLYTLLKDSNYSEEQDELYTLNNKLFFKTHKVLIHMVSLYLFVTMKVHEYKEDIESVISNKDSLYKCFDTKNSIGNTRIESFVTKELKFSRSDVDIKTERLINAISDDIRVLCKILDNSYENKLSCSELEKYLRTDINKENIRIHESPSKKELELVIFDLDEGIVNSENALFQLTNDLINEKGNNQRSTLSIDEYAKNIGISETNFFRKLQISFNFDDNYTAQNFIEDRDERYIKFLQKANILVGFKPGLYKLLERLNHRQIPCSIHSNASRKRLIATLENLGCKHFFKENDIISGTDPKMEEKPSPVMIRTTLDNHNIKAENCLVIESTTTGLISARNAGCFCIMIANDFSDPDILRLDQRGVMVFDNMLHLNKWFVKEFLERG